MRTGLNSIKRKYITKNLGEKVSSKCSFNHKLVKGNKEKLYAMTHKNQLFIWIRTSSNEFESTHIFLAHYLLPTSWIPLFNNISPKWKVCKCCRDRKSIEILFELQSYSMIDYRPFDRYSLVKILDNFVKTYS